jgi:hypothetical protein
MIDARVGRDGRPTALLIGWARDVTDPLDREEQAR